MISMISRRIFLILIFLMLLLISFFPLINAVNTIDVTNKEDCCIGGRIFGGVCWVTGGLSGAVIPFASVKIVDVKEKHCNLIGLFDFRGLKLNRTYEVVADAHGYDNYSMFVTLTDENPVEEIYFYLEKNDEDKAVNKPKASIEESSCDGMIYGTVFGIIGGFQAYVPFADIEIEGVKKKKCGLQGGYVFRDLQINRTYNITADSYGYKKRTERVILTEEKPCEDRFFFLEQDLDENSKSKTLDIDCCFSGSIYGVVTETPEQYYAPPPIPFLTIKTDYKTTKTNFRGKYRLNGLPLNEEIVISTCSSVHYNDNETIILTEENSEQEVNFQITQIPYEPRGRIYGKVLGIKGDDHIFLPFANIEIEGLENKKCNFNGEYEFYNLELGKVYNVTADYNGYKKLTKNISITEGSRIHQVYFNLEKCDDIKSKSKIFGLLDFLENFFRRADSFKRFISSIIY